MKLQGKIVFSSGRAGDFDIWTVELGSGQCQQLTQGDFMNDMPRWSPDGQSVVYVSNRSGAPELWLMDENGHNQRQLTRQGRYHSHPCWAPHGRMVVCCANYGNAQEVEIWTVPVDGGQPTLLVETPGLETEPCVSPDGTRVAFASNKSGNFDIWEIDIATRRRRQVTSHPGKDFCPCYSPDGRWLSFVSRPSLEEDAEIWLVPADGGDQPVKLTENSRPDQYVSWAPDGSALVYCSSKSGPGSGRIHLLDLEKLKGSMLDYNRSPMEQEIGAGVRDFGFFTWLMPDKLQRHFVDSAYFGSERYPHWKF